MFNAVRFIGGKRYDPEIPGDISETLVKAKAGSVRVVSGSGGVPVPLAEAARPDRPADLAGWPAGEWVEGAEWLYGGVGYQHQQHGCHCWNARFCLDYFARSFAPETRHFSVAVLDSAGNLVLRVGQYGNVDDGKPLDPKGGPPNTRPIGGDEVSLFHAPYLATQTDRRLFIADPGNARILSVKLGYHAEEKIALKDVPEQAGKK
jgi:hypothetical protein